MKFFGRIKHFKFTGSNIVNIVGAVVVIYLVVVLGETIKRNYDLGGQIDGMKAQMSLLQEQNNQLSYNIQYYKTSSYQDKEARSQLGLQLPGEHVIIIPNDTPEPAPTITPVASQPAKSNFQQWLSFLGGSN
jgi:cell division protein FtsB